ncbi:MAG TPA: PDZ domain-containing protein [Pseudoxanthomonas sp.]|nr:PDZ domain-containing protein [Pseudoxanthomonas sp.]
MKPVIRITSILLATALAAVPAAAGAQTATAKDADTRALESARAELARAARRLAELQGTEATPLIELQSRAARRPVLGVVLAPDAQAGVRIAGVTPESGAEQAGLKAGDRLRSIDGKRLSGADAQQRVTQATGLLANLERGKPVEIGYERDGREANVSATPKVDRRMMLWSSRTRDGAPAAAEPALREAMKGLEIARMGIAPGVRSEIRRIAIDGDCGDGEDCRLPMMVEAFRWNGLNLAKVDAQLGRYFGTDSGVLVLSAGEDLAGLQPGDVIRTLDGKAVATPREAMSALRGKPAGSEIRVGYLRDRKTAAATLKVPRAVPFRIPAPAAPPAPPAPPQPPAAAKPVPPPAPPTPPSPAA